jgi:hypothetical protein
LDCGCSDVPYLIDTILCELPVPKIYIRTKINTKEQSSLREVVDGQQRVRAIYEFSIDNLRLSSRSEQYKGMLYSDLAPDVQEKFLGYTLSVEQLLNASDDDVIDIFARLNSYIVALNAAEKRHAAYQTEFKFAVRKASHDWRSLWEKHSIFTTKQRFRMADDVFMAEIFQIFLCGVSDGGAASIDTFYREQDDDVFTDNVNKALRKKIDSTLSYIDNNLSAALSGPFSKHYQLLMLIAAYAHHEYGIPKGALDKVPSRSQLAPPQTILDRLAKIEIALEADEPSPRYVNFVEASSSSTQRIASRKVRFSELVKVLAA